MMFSFLKMNTSLQWSFLFSKRVRFPARSPFFFNWTDNPEAIFRSVFWINSVMRQHLLDCFKHAGYSFQLVGKISLGARFLFCGTHLGNASPHIWNGPVPPVCRSQSLVTVPFSSFFSPTQASFFSLLLFSNIYFPSSLIGLRIILPNHHKTLLSPPPFLSTTFVMPVAALALSSATARLGSSPSIWGSPTIYVPARSVFLDFLFRSDRPT